MAIADVITMGVGPGASITTFLTGGLSLAPVNPIEAAGGEVYVRFADRRVYVVFADKRKYAGWRDPRRYSNGGD
jgi:hypothetical protein